MLPHAVSLENTWLKTRKKFHLSPAEGWFFRRSKTEPGNDCFRTNLLATKNCNFETLGGSELIQLDSTHAKSFI